MQGFSSTVRDLYALAEYASPDQFLTRAIGLMQMWIRFDGAIFGTGEVGDHGVDGVCGTQWMGPPASAGVIGRHDGAGNGGQVYPASAGGSTPGMSRHTATDSMQLKPARRTASAADDPVAQGFRNAPLSPTRGGIRVLYRKRQDGKRLRERDPQRESGSFRSLAEELGMCHLMLHGDDPNRVRPARWIVLYRQHDVRFAESDAAALHGLWVHLSRALAINRARAAERLPGATAYREHAGATGLINDEGQVEIADQRFFDLLEREWPELTPEFIPHEAMEALNQDKPYRGTQVEISLVRQAGCNLCRIRPVDAMEVLTPREFVVARRFAAGMSHKQIARELGVSHHTVRNQLAHLYRKLNLHDKASLAQYLSTNLGAH
jgi:DNA-binding CsgD family transcriptional regulator